MRSVLRLSGDCEYRFQLPSISGPMRQSPFFLFHSFVLDILEMNVVCRCISRVMLLRRVYMSGEKYFFLLPALL